MLRVLPPTSNLPCNESPKLLTGMNEGGKRSLFHSAFCNKLHVFAARFIEDCWHLWRLVLKDIAIWYQNRQLCM